MHTGKSESFTAIHALDETVWCHPAHPEIHFIVIGDEQTQIVCTRAKHLTTRTLLIYFFYDKFYKERKQHHFVAPVFLLKLFGDMISETEIVSRPITNKQKIKHSSTYLISTEIRGLLLCLWQITTLIISK